MIEMSYSVGRKWIETGARLEEQDQKKVENEMGGGKQIPRIKMLQMKERS